MTGVSEKQAYYGRRGNEIVIVEVNEDQIDVRSMLISGDEEDFVTMRYCTLPKNLTEMNITGKKLSVKADIPEMLEVPKRERGDIMTGFKEVVLWPDPSEYFDLSNEYDAMEWEEICETKEAIEAYRAIPEEDLFEIEVTVMSDGAEGKFNCMKSLEVRYAELVHSLLTGKSDEDADQKPND